MRTVREALSHPQWTHLAKWGNVSTSAGPLKGWGVFPSFFIFILCEFFVFPSSLVLKPVVHLESEGEQPGDSLGRVPNVGENTRAILSSLLKYEEKRIAELFEKAVVE